MTPFAAEEGRHEGTPPFPRVYGTQLGSAPDHAQMSVLPNLAGHSCWMAGAPLGSSVSWTSARHVFTGAAHEPLSDVVPDRHAVVIRSVGVDVVPQELEDEVVLRRGAGSPVTPDGPLSTLPVLPNR